MLGSQKRLAALIKNAVKTRTSDIQLRGGKIFENILEVEGSNNVVLKLRIYKNVYKKLMIFEF